MNKSTTGSLHQITLTAIWYLPIPYQPKLFVRLSPSPEEQRIDAIRQLPLEPMEYCRRWVNIDPARGYRKACIKALAQATGLSPHTIKDWGSNFDRRPHYIPFLLRQADLLNQFKQLVSNQQIILPPNFPVN